MNAGRIYPIEKECKSFDAFSTSTPSDVTGSKNTSKNPKHTFLTYNFKFIHFCAN